MKTIMKRTVSVILTLCLLMGIMVPMVSAEDVVYATIVNADGTTKDYTDESKARSAMAAATAEDEIVIKSTVQFNKAYTINAKKITLAQGAKLDTNGKQITATNTDVDATAPGAAIINTASGNGWMKVKSLACNTSNDGYLPVKSGSGYIFSMVEVTIAQPVVNVTNDVAEVRFRVTFAKNLYAVVEQYAETGVEIGGVFNGGINGEAIENKVCRINYDDETTLAAKWCGEVAKKGAANVSKGAIVLTFSGLENFEELSMTPYISSDTGVIITATDAQILKTAA